ncbi:MAG: ABC transporter substrate-binding protein [Cyanobacteria bacterium P01_G01_bin.54]
MRRHPLRRRKLLKHLGLGSSAAIALTACQARQTSPLDTELDTADDALPTLTWRMGTSWPKSLDIIYGAAEAFCTQVSDLTDGKFTITPFPSGELAPPLELLEGVANNDFECAHTTANYNTNDYPALSFCGASFPFGLTAQQHNAWFYEGGGLELMHDIYAELGVIAFPVGDTATQMGGWFNREINTIEDLNGLRFRISGIGSEVLERFGVKITLVAGSEILNAFSNDKVDAVEWINPYEDEKLGLHRAAKYYYAPGWWGLSEPLTLMINLAQWNRLPTPYQTAMKLVAKDVSIQLAAQYNAVNGFVLAKLVAQGTELRTFSPEILKPIYETTQEVLQEKASQDAVFRRAYEQFTAFQQRIYRWNRLNEVSFAQLTAQDGAAQDGEAGLIL